MRMRAHKRKVRQRPNAMEDATIREFGGGWNVVDNDLNLSSRFSVIMDNVSRDEDGSIGVRWGSELLADTDDANWIDPVDLTLVAFDTHASSATYDSVSTPVTNPAAWYNDVYPELNADSTRAEVVTDFSVPKPLEIVVEGTYSVATNVDIIIARSPSDGLTATTKSLDGETFTFTVEVNVENVGWVIAREQEVAYNNAGTSVSVSSIDGLDGDPLSSYNILGARLTVLDSTVPRDDTFAIAIDEFAAYNVGGLGTAPADVEIINITYFQQSTVVVMSNGYIIRVLGDGTQSIVWSPAVAAGLVGAPAGWTDPIDFASFAVFNGELIICNGIDKPLIVDFDAANPVQYLQDLGTGSNVNVPIARYVLAAGNFLLMAGDPLFPDRVHISNEQTSGTWFGDDTPNNATFVDLGKVGVQGDQKITGINRYRKQVVVTFFSSSVLGTLNIFDDALPPNHTPDFEDVIEGFGGHSHRAMVNLGNDLFILDNQGITSVARSLLSGTLEPKRVSELIDPEVNKNVNRLTEDQTLLNVFGVYNSNDKQYMCFVPNHSSVPRSVTREPFAIVPERPTVLRATFPNHNMLVGDRFSITNAESFNDVLASNLNGTHTITRVIDENIIEFMPPNTTTNLNKELIGGGVGINYAPLFTETLCYVYTFINELKVRSWSRFRGWKFRAGTRTELGNVIFADRKRLFVYGNLNNPIYQDFIGTNNVKPIEFAWELPWNDVKDRMMSKKVRYLGLDVKGHGQFTVQTFIDNLYMREGQLIPTVQATFTAQDVGGYGNGSQPFGGGRNTGLETLYDWPLEGNLIKMRFSGSTSEQLRFVAFSLLYQKGSIYR